ncbi:polysaccharide biosynthesis tyrosine autokinase [Roseiconus nitratireducens]|uniref:non-specific protein-tyrosine kinase n=1 Tax=Roseiconus nitratireducens TaxID=2605748 RepID=A0A5M6D0Q4_9BACT|nr:tyrosine-protein kinase domain-containing protein [Roseiconus nitratireducens]KAA5539862.1 polysaccharide biosynthesis tyrosine autokinase [Roseiconus nitratireducens]
MIAQQPGPTRASRPSSVTPTSPFPQSVDVVGALWRYRWAVVLPALLLGVIGFLVYLRTEETYRCTTRLMVESNRPPIFDAMTGEVVGGVPDIEVLEAQLYSDKVATMAYSSVEMQPFRGRYESDVQVFIKKVQEQLELEPEVTDVKTAQSLVTLLHFESPDTELCEAAIKSYSRALQQYFNDRHKSSQGDLKKLIDAAIGELAPDLKDAEQRYADFRRDAGLSWDNDGKAINPHREQQQYLTQRRATQYEELRRAQTILASMESVAEQATDPRIALNVMSQLLGVKVSTIGAQRDPDPIVGDSLLAEIDLEKKLLPLIVERNRNEREFGASHPTVKALDNELETTRTELLRLVRDQAERVTKLRKEWFQDLGDPIEQAEKTVEAVLFSKRAEVKMLQAHIKELDEQIMSEKLKAVELADAEQTNEQLLREIEQYRELMGQLKENMGRIELSEDDEGLTQVVELWAPTKAYLVGPSLLKMAGVGTVLGLLLGGGLAILLEKNANTFRDPDEISSLLGVPILTHVPFFRGKKRKVKKGDVDPYGTLSTDLAVVHQPSSTVAEAIRSLRTAVFFDAAGARGGRVLQVTSPLPGDGKSTIACNLACSIAQSGKRVLAIDCDLRRPQLTDNFDLDDKQGLTSVLNGDCDPLEATHQTPLPTLSIMPCGPIPSNPAEALSLPLMNELLDHLREHFDYIVLDTPPLLVVTDPSIVASMADALVLTLRIRRKSKPNAREAMNILQGVGANVLGVVINNSDEAGSSDGYRGYGYYKHGRYGGQYRRRNGQGNATSVAVSHSKPLRRLESQIQTPVNGANHSARSASEPAAGGQAAAGGQPAANGSNGTSKAQVFVPPDSPAVAEWRSRSDRSLSEQISSEGEVPESASPEPVDLSDSVEPETKRADIDSPTADQSASENEAGVGRAHSPG